MTACANPDLLRPLAGAEGLVFLSLEAAAARPGWPGRLADLPRAFRILAEDILWRLPADQAAAEIEALVEAAAGNGAAGLCSLPPAVRCCRISWASR